MGFVPIPDWRSCFWHKELSLLLVVYVDDFKMSGPSANISKGWQLIRKGVKTEDPVPSGKYLGCDHVIDESPIGSSNPEIWSLFELPPAPTDRVSGPLPRGGDDPGESQEVKGARVSEGYRKMSRHIARTLEWRMDGFFRQCVELCKEIGGPCAQNLRKVETPFERPPPCASSHSERASSSQASPSSV